MINVKSMERQKQFYGWLFVIPGLISILVFIVYPIIFAGIMSFTNWRSLFVDIKFIGFDNYRWLFSSSGELFWEGIEVSFKFATISTLIQTVLGFLLASVLYNLSNKAQGVYKVLLYTPVILPAAVVSVMWSFIYKPEVGLIDQLLRGIFNLTNTPLWIADERIALYSVIATNTWRFVGITMIIYFVAMNAISKEVIESARIDGASKTQVLTKIMLPLTWRSTQINILLSIIGGMKSFDLFYLLTGGEAGTRVVGLHIYKTAFEYNQFARAVTMSLVLTVIIGGITLIVNRVFRNVEDY
ncbi:MAG: sugar ABC transporter permease [Acholeplasmataceae bacterium]|nr:sugar ABC transporter permease [Acholeplasmataceae bacterium]